MQGYGPDAYVGRARCHFEKEHYEEAVADFSESLCLHGADTQVQSEMGFAFRRLRLSKIDQQQIPNIKADIAGERVPKRQLDELRRNIRQQTSVTSFRSRIVVRDLLSSDFEPYGQEIVRWEFDFVIPDSFHIHQFTRLENFPRGALEEWITIGSDQYSLIATYILANHDPKFEIERFVGCLKLEPPEASHRTWIRQS